MVLILVVVGLRFMREQTKKKEGMGYVRCLGRVNFLVLVLEWMGLVRS